MRATDRLPPDADLVAGTARLVLTPLTAADAGELATVLDDPELHRFTGGEPLSEAELSARFTIWEGRRSPDGGQVWLNWTVRLAAGGQAVGYVQATIDEERAVVAYVIGTAWSGRGIASEALVAVCDLLRRRLGVDRIVAHIHPLHVASSRVAGHAGLTSTGIADEDGELIWEWRSGVHADPPDPPPGAAQAAPGRS